MFTFDMIVAVSMVALYCGIAESYSEDDEAVSSDPLFSCFSRFPFYVFLLPCSDSRRGIQSVQNFTKLWRPFAGPEFFVMCEAIAWTIFVPSFVGNILILAAHRRQDRRSSLSYIVGWCVCVESVSCLRI